MAREQEIENEAYRDSYNSYEFESFIQGAEWADETMIKKTCEWLQAKNKMYMFEIEMILGKNFIEDFKKAMVRE